MSDMDGQPAGESSDRKVLRVDIRLDGGIAVIALSGELDLNGTGQVSDGVSLALDAGARTVGFDLGDLDFIDSSGIRAIVIAQGDCRAAGVRLQIVGSSARVARALELNGVEDLFPGPATASTDQ